MWYILSIDVINCVIMFRRNYEFSKNQCLMWLISLLGHVNISVKVYIDDYMISNVVIKCFKWIRKELDDPNLLWIERRKKNVLSLFLVLWFS